MSHKLTQAIRARVGAHPRAAEHYRSVVLAIHRELESEAVERNCALREICDQFGVDQGFLTVRMRAGQDYHQEKKFDLMAAYAESHYPHLLNQDRRTESESGTAEERLARWAAEGIQSIPNPWDDEILAAADAAVGPAFWESLADMHDEEVEQAICRLETYYAKVVEDIEKEQRGEGGRVCWPKYRLTRLQNEIEKLPEQVRDVAIQRSRLYEIEEMVFSHVVPF